MNFKLAHRRWIIRILRHATGLLPDRYTLFQQNTYTLNLHNNIHENHICSILLHLQKHSFDELVDLKIISRRTKYNYIKALEKIGLSRNHIAVDSDDIKKSEDFEVYHQHVIIK